MPTRTTVAIVIACLMVGAALWWSSPGAAAGALTADDHIEIQQLYSRYYQTIDAGESEAWADTFTPDGSFNTTVQGREALIASNRRGGRNRRMRHLHSNLTITPSGNGANGSVYVVQIDITATPPTVATYSRYDDTLVQTSQGWRFKTRQRSSDTTILRTPAR